MSLLQFFCEVRVAQSLVFCVLWISVGLFVLSIGHSIVCPTIYGPGYPFGIENSRMARTLFWVIYRIPNKLTIEQTLFVSNVKFHVVMSA